MDPRAELCCGAAGPAGAESLVCALAMLGAAPLIAAALHLATGLESLAPFWALVLVGETSLCLYWAPIAAFMMLVVTPARRATAQGLALLASHLLGDAASPVVVGQVVDSILRAHRCDTSHRGGGNATLGSAEAMAYAQWHGAPALDPMANGWAGNGSNGSCAAPHCAWANATEGAASGCTNSNAAQVAAYQTGLYLTVPAMVVAGVFFLWGACYQPADHRTMLAAMAQAQRGGAAQTSPLLSGADGEISQWRRSHFHASLFIFYR